MSVPGYTSPQQMVPQYDINAYLRQPSSSPIMQRANIPSGAPNLTPFKAPAHKHAHHLHSIPPREKSTRTLIIDHLLWVHGRTRFAQARAELGMTDRTGGLSSRNYMHRERPENFEEEEEAYSDGEDAAVLRAREGGPEHTHGVDEEDRLDRQDLDLACSLRQRAESVEKTATAMLDQPPEVRPLPPDDMLEPPTSPSLQPQARQHQHTLPNGVRLRLALATVINDFFSRRAPDPPTRSPAVSLGPSAPISSVLPSSLVRFAGLSSACLLPGMPRLTHKPVASEYIKSLYAIGSDPDTSNSPPSLRCPRHLHMSCEICVEAKTQYTVRPGQSRGRSTSGRAGSTTGSSPAEGSISGGPVIATGITGWQDGSGIGSGLARPGGPLGTVLRRPSIPNGPNPTRDNAGPTMFNTKLAELIPRFMRLSALVAMELGREATEDRASVDGGERREEDTAGTSNGAPATPRPVPLSPQISPRRHPSDSSLFNALRPSREWYLLFAGIVTRAVLEGYLTANWRGVQPLELLLGIGLSISPTLVRSRPSESTTSNSPGTTAGRASGGDDPQFTEFDPDDLPDLEEATKILFPALREPLGGGNNPLYFARESAELEYEIEMTERLARFYAVPQTTPDVATHMEDLAWQFPAEAVERATVRFCEAVARWRGKPEVETYKRASWIIGSRDHPVNGAASSNGAAAMSIESLVHSSPISPSASTSTQNTAATPTSARRPEYARSRRPAIQRYFTIPPSFTLNRKRRRDENDRGDEGRRAPMHPPTFG